MSYKYLFICENCGNEHPYKVNVGKRYKCKKCGHRVASKVDYKDTVKKPRHTYYLVSTCPNCGLVDFKFPKNNPDKKYCTECGEERDRIEFLRKERVGDV